VLLGRSVSSIPRSVEVVVKVTHGNLEHFEVICRVVGNLRNRAIKFFLGFSQMEKNGDAIHEREVSNCL